MSDDSIFASAVIKRIKKSKEQKILLHNYNVLAAALGLLYGSQEQYTLCTVCTLDAERYIQIESINWADRMWYEIEGFQLSTSVNPTGSAIPQYCFTIMK